MLIFLKNKKNLIFLLTIAFCSLLGCGFAQITFEKQLEQLETDYIFNADDTLLAAINDNVINIFDTESRTWQTTFKSTKDSCQQGEFFQEYFFALCDKVIYQWNVNSQELVAEQSLAAKNFTDLELAFDKFDVTIVGIDVEKNVVITKIDFPSNQIHYVDVWEIGKEEPLKTEKYEAGYETDFLQLENKILLVARDNEGNFTYRFPPETAQHSIAKLSEFDANKSSIFVRTDKNGKYIFIESNYYNADASLNPEREFIIHDITNDVTKKWLESSSEAYMAYSPSQDGEFLFQSPANSLSLDDVVAFRISDVLQQKKIAFDELTPDDSGNYEDFTYMEDFFGLLDMKNIQAMLPMARSHNLRFSFHQTLDDKGIMFIDLKTGEKIQAKP